MKTSSVQVYVMSHGTGWAKKGHRRSYFDFLHLINRLGSKLTMNIIKNAITNTPSVNLFWPTLYTVLSFRKFA